MRKYRIGILGPSNIAIRRFLPALMKLPQFEFIGVAVANKEEWPTSDLETEIRKASEFSKLFGGDVVVGYEKFINSKNLDAMYVPLPPSLHSNWGLRCLQAKKHVFIEKPFSTHFKSTLSMLKYASKDNLAVHENYAFPYHKQLTKIIHLINSNEIGDIRRIRAEFGFPYRGIGDFRYYAKSGGGALYDCGGYPTKLVSILLGETTYVKASILNQAKNHDVDVYGSAMLTNKENVSAHISFGMDNSYKCDLEIWGSYGSLFAPRIFTPPADLKTCLILNNKNGDKTIEIDADDQFVHSIERFYTSMENKNARNAAMNEISLQSKLIEDIFNKAK